MKYIITERQYRLLTEESGEKITYYPINFGNTEKDTAEKVRKIILDEVVALLVNKNININFFNKN